MQYYSVSKPQINKLGQKKKSHNAYSMRGREGGREEGREEGREGGRKGGREGGREEAREGGRESYLLLI